MFATKKQRVFFVNIRWVSKSTWLFCIAAQKTFSKPYPYNPILFKTLFYWSPSAAFFAASSAASSAAAARSPENCNLQHPYPKSIKSQINLVHEKTVHSFWITFGSVAKAIDCFYFDRLCGQFCWPNSRLFHKTINRVQQFTYIEIETVGHKCL